MSAHEKELHPDEKVKLGSLGPRTTKIMCVAGAVFLVISAILAFTGGADSTTRFLHTYLVSFTFFLSLALGALFFVLIGHLVSAKWSVVLRRLAEVLSMTFPLLAVLSLGILVPMFSSGSLYDWIGSTDHLIEKKAAYLNVPFFAIRVLIYFTIWILVARYFFNKSVEQDTTGDKALTPRMKVASAPAVFAFAFTTAFASYDFLMSLDAAWFSTMFGVYFFAGCAISIYALLALIAMFLQARGRLVHSITVEHYHDVGKWLFAFVFFWGYVAFSQFMLYWYADIPEETIWFRHRIMTDWKWFSWVLLLGHFVFPFVILLSRETKRRLQLLAFFSVWMLLMHFLDLFWIVMPEFKENVRWFDAFQPMDLTTLLGMGGLFLAYAAWVGTRVNLIAVKDPDLGKSLGFENY